MFPILNPPPHSLPIPSLWVVPVHQPQASSIVHRTWAGNSFHTWYFTCFNAILPNLPTLSLSHRVHKTVLYISVSFAVLYTGLSMPFSNSSTGPLFSAGHIQHKELSSEDDRCQLWAIKDFIWHYFERKQWFPCKIFYNWMFFQAYIYCLFVDLFLPSVKFSHPFIQQTLIEY